MAPILDLEPEMLLGNLPDVDQLPLRPGRAGNMDTVEKMTEIARRESGLPLVRELAKQILLQYDTASMNYLDEALAIGDYVKRKVRYVRDARDYEQIHSPSYLIEKIRSGTAQGDCDDMALLTATLLLAVGHQPFFRMVRYKAFSGPYNHIYVVEYEKNGDGAKQRVVLDCILKTKPIGTELPFASGDEVEV